eukprot:scaffold6860_cov297-Chaetoceros_neogracile.AAC.35
MQSKQMRRMLCISFLEIDSLVAKYKEAAKDQIDYSIGILRWRRKPRIMMCFVTLIVRMILFARNMSIEANSRETVPCVGLNLRDRGSSSLANSAVSLRNLLSTAERIEHFEMRICKLMTALLLSRCRIIISPSTTPTQILVYSLRSSSLLLYPLEYFSA